MRLHQAAAGNALPLCVTLALLHAPPPLQIASTLMGGEAAAAVDGDKLRQLKADVAMQLNALRNAAYAGGFAAARGAIAATLAGDFA